MKLLESKNLEESFAEVVLEEPTVVLEEPTEADEIESSELSENSFDKHSLRQKLGGWFHRNKPSRRSFEEMLLILNQENHDVPLSAKFFCVKRDPLAVSRMSPGFFSHFGIRNQL